MSSCPSSAGPPSSSSSSERTRRAPRSIYRATRPTRSGTRAFWRRASTSSPNLSPPTSCCAPYDARLVKSDRSTWARYHAAELPVKTKQTLGLLWCAIAFGASLHCKGEDVRVVPDVPIGGAAGSASTGEGGPGHGGARGGETGGGASASGGNDGMSTGSGGARIGS